MAGGEWLNGVIPGNGSLRPGGYHNHSNYSNQSHRYHPHSYPDTGNGKTTTGASETGR
jgi:hypothetical protein